MLFSIQVRNSRVRVYTPGALGWAHPKPHDVTPAADGNGFGAERVSGRAVLRMNKATCESDAVSLPCSVESLFSPSSDSTLSFCRKAAVVLCPACGLVLSVVCGFN